MAKKNKKESKKGAAKKSSKEKAAGNSNKKVMLKYIGLVSFFSVLCMILSNQLWFQPYSQKILAGYALVSSFFLNLAGQGTSVTGHDITSSGYSISIKKGCDAVAPMILYIFAISFFPADLKVRQLRPQFDFE